MSGKRDDILERQSLVFIQYSSSYSGSWRKPREHSDFLKDDSNGFGEIPSARESLWEGFLKVVEASASHWSQSDSSLRNLNIVFRFRQPSLNSAKPPRPALCGFALSPELSNSLRFSPNNTMSRVGTESLLLFIFRESGKYAINEYPAGI